MENDSEDVKRVPAYQAVYVDPAVGPTQKSMKVSVRVERVGFTFAVHQSTVKGISAKIQSIDNFRQISAFF